MTKWICEECVKPCKLDFGMMVGWPKSTCPIYGPNTPKWREVKPDNGVIPACEATKTNEIQPVNCPPSPPSECPSCEAKNKEIEVLKAIDVIRGDQIGKMNSEMRVMKVDAAVMTKSCPDCVTRDEKITKLKHSLSDITTELADRNKDLQAELRISGRKLEAAQDIKDKLVKILEFIEALKPAKKGKKK